MIKKFLLTLAFAVALVLGGCQDQEKELENAFENMDTAYSEVLRTVLSKEWEEVGGEDIWKFAKDGTGNILGQGFTYRCGFDKENQMLLQIVMDDTEEERNFYVSTDDTGYGLYLQTPEGEKVYLFQTNMELLDSADERAAGLLGEWKDGSGNRYVLKEDRTMVIRYVDGGETEGNYSAAERRVDGELILTLVFNRNTLDYSYGLSADGMSVTLSAPGADMVYEWTKVK